MKKILLFASLLLIILLLNIDITIVSVILMPIAQSLRLGVNQVSWVFIIYLLFFAALIVTGGRLGDSFGHRIITVLGLSIFALASIVCALSHELWQLLIGRALLACGAALIWPNVTVIMYSQFDEKRRPIAIGLLASMVGLGLSLGPSLGGLITHLLNWHWIFWMNLPLSSLPIFALLLLPIKQLPKKQEPLSWGSATLLGLSIALLVYVINELSADTSWHYLLLMLFAAVFCFMGYLWKEHHSAMPLLPLFLFRQPVFIKACLFRFLTVGVIYTVLFVLGLFLQQHWHLSPMMAGLVFLAMTIPIGLVSLLVGKLIEHFGTGIMLVISTLLGIVGAIWLCCIIASDNVLMLVGPLIFLGLCFSISSPTTMVMGLGAAKEEDRGTASGVFYMISMFSGVIIVALDTAIIAVQNAHKVTLQAFILCFVLLVICNVLVLAFNLFTVFRTQQ